MTKQKINLEYMLQAKSANSIWNMIATPSGLSRWFADDVDQQKESYTFYWGKHESRNAEILSVEQGKRLRLRWEDESDDTYFEMRICKGELTGDFTLEITDFAESDEVNEVKDLWEHQMQVLYKTGGA